MRKEREIVNNKLSSNKTISGLIKKNHEEHGDLPALYLGENEKKKVSFTDLYFSIKRIQDFLLQNFRESHIAILGENYSEWFIAYLGIICSDCVAVLIEKELPPDEILARLIYTDCKAIFISDTYIDYEEKFEKNGIKVISLKCIGSIVNEVISGDKDFQGELECFSNVDLPAQIVFTSGTSGDQKAVMLSQKNIIENMYAGCSRYYIESNSVCLVPLPLYHVFTLTSVMGISLVFRGIVNFSTPRNIIKDLIRLQPDCVILVPAIIRMIYDKIEEMTNEKINNLFGKRLIILCGGASLPIDIQEKLCRKEIEIVYGYGITECSPIISMDTVKAGVHIGSVGRAISCCEVFVNAPDKNGIGELAVSGENVMMGYYKDAAATNKVLKDGILYTGDMGYIDDEGYIYITGRKKNLIILSNGKNVSPEEIESKFLSLNYVQEVCVYEENDKIVGEFYLDIERYPDAKSLLEKDIVTVNRSLPKYKNITEIRMRNIPFEKNQMMKSYRKK